MDCGKLTLNLCEGGEGSRTANTSFKNNQLEEVALPDIKVLYKCNMAPGYIIKQPIHR